MFLFRKVGVLVSSFSCDIYLLCNSSGNGNAATVSSCLLQHSFFLFLVVTALTPTCSHCKVADEAPDTSAGEVRQRLLPLVVRWC